MRYSEAEKAKWIEHVCSQLAEKRFLSDICKEDEGVPPHATLMRWCDENPEWRRAYERARETGCTRLLEENIAIADEAVSDAYIAYDQSGKPYAKLDGDSVRRAALRVNARERFAQLMAPHLYGPRMDVTSGGKPLPAPAPTLVINNRVDALLVLAQQRKAEGTPLIDISPSEPDTLDDIMK